MTAMRALVCLIVLGGCGRLQFDPLADAQDTCWPAWLSGTPQVSAPRPIVELNTGVYEADPFLAADDQTLYFSRDNGPTGLDVFVARRAGRGQPFDPPIVETSLSSASEESRLALTDDGLAAVISTNRPPTSVPTIRGSSSAARRPTRSALPRRRCW